VIDDFHTLFFALIFLCEFSPFCKKIIPIQILYVLKETSNKKKLKKLPKIITIASSMKGA
jgi:hypothetical protein